MESFRELTQRITDGTLEPVAQDLSLRSYFGFYDRPAAAQILGFEAPAENLERLVRALDFGTYPNPVGTPKIVTSGGAVSVAGATVLEQRSGAAPGSVLSVDDDGITVATATHDIRLTGARTAAGTALSAALWERLGIKAGATLPGLDEAARTRLTQAAEQAAKSEGFFLRRLSVASPLDLSLPAPDEGARAGAHSEVAVPDALRKQPLLPWLLAFLARYSGATDFDVAYADPSLRERSTGAWQIFASAVPLRVHVDADAKVSDAVQGIDAQCRKLSCRASSTWRTTTTTGGSFSCDSGVRTI